MSKLSLVSVNAALEATNSKLDALLTALSGQQAPPPSPTPLQQKLAEMERVQAELAAMQNISGNGNANPNGKYFGAVPPVPPPVKQAPPPFVPHIRQSEWKQGNKNMSTTLVDFGYIAGKPFQFGAGKARMILDNLPLLHQLVAIDDTLHGK